MNNPHLFVTKILGPLYFLCLNPENLNKLLSTWHTPSSRNLLGKIFFNGVFNHWINNVYLIETDPNRRESLKDVCLTGDSGVAWAQVYENRPVEMSNYGDLDFDVALPWLKSSCLLIEKSPKNTIFIQLGCSSGREIDLLSEKYPDRQFIGSDIDDQIIKQARINHPRENLIFKVERAHEIGGDISDDTLL